MAWHYVALAVAAALGLAGAVAVVIYWHQAIRETVARWLREHGWAASFLMDAWILLDRVFGVLRQQIFARTQDGSTRQVEESYPDLDQIDDPDVLRELEARGLATRNIMDLVN